MSHIFIFGFNVFHVRMVNVNIALKQNTKTAISLTLRVGHTHAIIFHVYDISIRSPDFPHLKM